MCENTSCATEIRNLQTALDDAQALLAGAQRDLSYEQESARTIEAKYSASVTSLNLARDLFERIYDRDSIDLSDDSLYEDLATALGFEALVKVWVTIKVEWSQEVSLPRGFNDQRIEIETDIPDRLSISYEGNELDTELTRDGVEVEASE